MDIKDKVQTMSIDGIYPYINNPKTHPPDQIDKLCSSIKNYGFTVPIVIDGDNEIIAGHGRYKAAQKLGMKELPVIKRDDLTDAQVKGLRIADNKVAESEWDYEALAVEFDELDFEDFDLELTGFEEDEIDDIWEDLEPEPEVDSEKYTDKIESPTYEPTREEQPPINELIDTDKFEKLLNKIKKADIPKYKKDFLKLAAHRHIVFDYENIAEYYAHADKKVQELMEDLALVIIDMDKAIEEGFTKFSKDILKDEK